MKKLPGPSVTVHPARTRHTHPVAFDARAPCATPEPPDISAIDETQLKILSTIAKVRGRAQDRVRATLSTRGPISAARGMAPTDKHQEERKAAEDISPEKKDSSEDGREADGKKEEGKKEEGKAPSAKTKRRRRRKKARKQRVSAPPRCDAAPCRDVPGI